VPHRPSLSDPKLTIRQIIKSLIDGRFGDPRISVIREIVDEKMEPRRHRGMATDDLIH
jgi:hypothetical protein